MEGEHSRVGDCSYRGSYDVHVCPEGEGLDARLGGN